MTTHQIEQAANRGDIATADFPIALVLRQQCIPAFLEDCGRIRWRTKTYTFTTTAGVRKYTLPRDFFEVDNVYVDAATDPLFYIGEDAQLVAQAEAASDAATDPGLVSYYLLPDETDDTRTALVLNVAPDEAADITVSYFWYLPFEDEEEVDLRSYFPEQYHWALVDILRREIIDDRFGQGDQRYAAADAKYQEWLKRIANKRALAPRGNKATYVR